MKGSRVGRLRTIPHLAHQLPDISQIRLLAPEVTDVDGIRENRSDTVSVFNGQPPEICVLKGEKEEIKAVSIWLIRLVRFEPAESDDQELDPANHFRLTCAA